MFALVCVFLKSFDHNLSWQDKLWERNVACNECVMMDQGLNAVFNDFIADFVRFEALIHPASLRVIETTGTVQILSTEELIIDLVKGIHDILSTREGPARLHLQFNQNCKQSLMSWEIADMLAQSHNFNQ